MPGPSRPTRTSRPAAVTALRRVVARHRRLLAAGLVAAAVAVGLTALAPSPPDTVAVLVAARDLPGGYRLTATDLTTLRVSPDGLPDGALADADAALGRVLASAVRRHEPLTDVRMVAPALLSAQRGDGSSDVVATPLRIADPDVVALLQPGDRVDVLGAEAPAAVAADAAIEPGAPETDQAPVDGTTRARATVVARDVLVLSALTSTGEEALAAGTFGGLLVLQTSRTEASAVVAAAAAGPVAVVLRPR